MRADSLAGQIGTALSRGPDAGRAPDVATGRGFFAQVRIALARTGTPYGPADHRGGRTPGAGRFGWVFPILLITGGILGATIHWIGLLAGVVLLMVVFGYSLRAVARRPRPILPAAESRPGGPARTVPGTTGARAVPAHREGYQETHAPPPRGGRANRFVVCGDNALAYQLANELAGRFGAQVTVVVPNGDSDWGPRIRHLPGVRMVQAARVDDTTLAAAGVAQARALALVGKDDTGNIRAALQATELNPDVRLVIRIADLTLGVRVRTLFAECAVLSDSATAAQAFVAAALGWPALSHIRLPGRTLYLADRRDVPADRIVSGLASTATGHSPQLLPADQDLADMVLAVADGTRARPGHRRHWWGRFRSAVSRPAVWIAITLLALFVATTLVLTISGQFDGIAQFWLTILADLTVVPVIVAAVVVTATRGPSTVPRRLSGHVVVVGLGDIGAKVATQLHDLGITVVCVESDEGARGVDVARELRLPIVLGDAAREGTLRAAHAATSRAVLPLTGNDVVNVQIALRAQALHDDARVVLRLADDDLAERVERVLGLAIARSPALLAAPGFAAAMVEHQVIGTIAIGRQVLVVAEVPVAAHSGLVGRSVDVVNSDGRVRVIAVRRHDIDSLDWTPAPTDRLAALDRLVVVATRRGLGDLVAISQPAHDHSLE